jgi:hypothetical protein
MDVQLRSVLVDAVDGTLFDASPVLDVHAGLADHVRHPFVLLERRSVGSALTILMACLGRLGNYQEEIP